MKIVDVLFAPGFGGFYNDDQAAIKAEARRDGFFYAGKPLTPGFNNIRMPAAALGIGLVLSDGRVSWGDMMTVQYSGVGGRESRFDPASLSSQLEESLVLQLIGYDVQSFRQCCHDLLTETQQTPSVVFGLTQALLSAVASSQNKLITEVVCDEYQLPLRMNEVPIYCQSGEARYDNVDKMILRRVDFLPHGLVNTPDLIGERGEAFQEYVSWVVERIRKHANGNYQPTLHFDVYGGIGDAFNNDINAIIDYLCKLQEIISPTKLQIEAVADFGGLTEQIEGFAAIRSGLKKRGCQIKLVADEWCNTLTDVNAFNQAGAADVIQLKMPDIGSLHDIILGIQSCQQADVGVYLGGSCTETDLSARIAVHIGIATQVDMLLAKPGMGVDEAYMIVANEQSRILSHLQSRMAEQKQRRSAYVR